MSPAKKLLEGVIVNSVALEGMMDLLKSKDPEPMVMFDAIDDRTTRELNSITVEESTISLTNIEKLPGLMMT
jgi:hypothetical protein